MSNFKVGDKVVIDFGNPANKDIATTHRTSMIDRVYTVIGIDDDSVDVDKPLMRGHTNGNGWFDYRFKLAKNEIIKDIINDLL